MDEIDIRITRHAGERMVERGIDLEDIWDTIMNPVQHIYDRWRDVYIAVNNRGFAVVYAYHGKTYEILTVLGRREYEALLSKHGFKRYKVIG